MSAGAAGPAEASGAGAGRRGKAPVNKSKLKKSIKSVLCRPDPEPWPVINEQQSKELEKLISKYRVPLQEEARPPWSVLKLLPKDQRPKSSHSKIPGGFTFGLSQVARLLKSGDCTGVIIDAGINPRVLVRHIVDAAVDTKTSIVCMGNLKNITLSYFGTQSCCLALRKSDIHDDLREIIAQYSKLLMPNLQSVDTMEISNEDQNSEPSNKVTANKEKLEKEIPFKYLYRTSKDYRVFVPPTKGSLQEKPDDFKGQNYIKFSENVKAPPLKKSFYKGMILKRISSNADRKKNK